MRIEVGYGLEGDLPDALAGRILNDNLKDIKSHDPKELNQAIRKVFNAVATVIDKKYKFPKDQNTVSDETMNQYRNSSQDSGGNFLTKIVFIFIAVVVVAIIFGSRGGGGRGGRRGRGDSSFWLWVILDALLSSGRRGGGGGFGGGFRRRLRWRFQLGRRQFRRRWCRCLIANIFQLPDSESLPGFLCYGC